MLSVRVCRYPRSFEKAVDATVLSGYQIDASISGITLRTIFNAYQEILIRGGKGKGTTNYQVVAILSQR